MKKNLLILLMASFLVGLAPEAFATETATATTSKNWELPVFKKKKSAKLSRAASAKKRNALKKNKKGSSKPKRNW